MTMEGTSDTTLPRRCEVTCPVTPSESLVEKGMVACFTGQTLPDNICTKLEGGNSIENFSNTESQCKEPSDLSFLLIIPQLLPRLYPFLFPYPLLLSPLWLYGAEVGGSLHFRCLGPGMATCPSPCVLSKAERTLGVAA